MRWATLINLCKKHELTPEEITSRNYVNENDKEVSNDLFICLGDQND